MKAAVRREAPAVAAVVVAVLAVLAPLTLGGRLASSADTDAFYAPFAAFLHDRLSAGDLPFWAPGAFSGSKKAAKAVASSIQIFLHDEILTRHTTPAAPITLADLDTRIGKIFTDAGLPRPTVTQKTDADLTAAGFERRTTARGTRWAAKAALLANPDSFMDTEGLSMGMFDFWVVFESKLTPSLSGYSYDQFH